MDQLCRQIGPAGTCAQRPRSGLLVGGAPLKFRKAPNPMAGEQPAIFRHAVGGESVSNSFGRYFWSRLTPVTESVADADGS